METIIYKWTTEKKVTADAHDYAFLRSNARMDFFFILVQAIVLGDAVAFKDAKFRKPSGVIYAQHQINLAQQCGNSTVEFAERLRLSVERLKCGVLTTREQIKFFFEMDL